MGREGERRAEEGGEGRGRRGCPQRQLLDPPLARGGLVSGQMRGVLSEVRGLHPPRVCITYWQVL